MELTPSKRQCIREAGFLPLSPRPALDEFDPTDIDGFSTPNRKPTHAHGTSSPSEALAHMEHMEQRKREWREANLMKQHDPIELERERRLLLESIE